MLDDRFELFELAGSGGMGDVFRAVDRATGAPVAIKLLRALDQRTAARFAREAQALAELEHPHIVRYVTHGVSASGEPYLVMEWLAGESLSQHLSRWRLGVEASVALARAAADALGAAHARGIVHRDVKPSNLFLVDGALDRVKVLDFGIARLPDATSRLTQTGAVVGTAGYMAPEQARGERETVDARADVFALGCVLFECLTGQPAFRGQNVMARIARLLMEEPPRVRELLPEVPPALDDLVARMLAKAPCARPDDGAAVVRCLDALRAEGRLAPARREAGEVVTRCEKRQISIVAVRPSRHGIFATAETLPIHPPPRSALGVVRQVTTPVGALVEELANGMVVATVAGAGSATDQATLVARCALRIRALLPDAAIALATGRSESTGSLPLGEVLDRAAALLADPPAPPGASGPPERVRVDAVTRALLDVQFEFVERDGRAWLEGEREFDGGARHLLGKPTPYVGRDLELRGLLDRVEESFSARRAAAALVKAPAGMGKSRLRHELVQELVRRHPDLELGAARGGAIGAGSAFAMLAGTLRSAMGIAAGEPREARQQKLVRAVGALFDGEKRREVAGFLGELLDAALPADGEPVLRAARQNPAMMADRIREAYLDYARAVTSARPMLVVLEDLHWGDAPSVKILDRALRDLADRPYAVLAFARPEIDEDFPRLWAERGSLELRLRELPAAAAEHLVRGALGASAAPETVAALVRRAGGNAFHLEELIRAVAEGRGDALPETVLGVVAARLAALGPEARRLLCAASVFGEVAWARGVRALLGTPAPGMDERDAWGELFDREILERRPSSRFPAEEEIAFRHALLREAAYAALADRERALGHGRAGPWLLEAGEQDPVVLAEHFARGGDGARAAELYARAAERSLRGADVPAALTRAQRGIDCGAAGETLAALHVLRMDAFLWDDRKPEAHASALRALAITAPGGHDHWRALSGALSCAGSLTDRRAVEALLPRLDAADVPPDALGAELACRICCALLWEGRPDLAERYERRLERDIAPAVEGDFYATTFVRFSRAVWLCHVERQPWGEAQECYVDALQRIEAVGHHRFTPVVWAYMAMCCVWLGAFEAADELIDRVLSSEGALGVASSIAMTYRVVAHLARQRRTEALDEASALLQRALAQGDHSRCAFARVLLIECHLLRGELAEAEAAHGAVGDPAALVPVLRAAHLSLLAEIRLRQRRAQEAAALCEQALEWSRRAGAVFLPRQEALPALYAEALHAAGDAAAAREVLRGARADVLARAARIGDPVLRKSFLEDVPTNARALSLARAWLGE